jgi:hypothetical protein
LQGPRFNPQQEKKRGEGRGGDRRRTGEKRREEEKYEIRTMQHNY